MAFHRSRDRWFVPACVQRGDCSSVQCERELPLQ
ncbi:MAG: hypothetical protein KDA92_12670 [Planctomycetales bacterium]|nr:hypothetical protein [Planctomycetales bacterium]